MRLRFTLVTLAALLALAALPGAASAAEPASSDPYPCSRLYPPQAREKQGVVTVGYDLGENGATRNVHVLTSSGNTALDAAAVACIAAGHIPDAEDGGVPSNLADQKARVQFFIFPTPPDDGTPPDIRAKWPSGPTVSVSDPRIVPSKAVGRTHDCSSYITRSIAAQASSGWTLVDYDVAADGIISNVVLKRSSGLPDFDAAALACVRERWRNTPAMMDGVAIASPGHEAVVSYHVN